MANGKTVKAGIGGWLILPAIGCVVAPILMLLVIFNNFSAMDTWEYSVVIDRFEGFEALVWFEIIGSFAFMFFVIYLAFRFFTKHPSLPKLWITYLWAQIGFCAIRFFWGVAIFGEYAEDVMPELIAGTGIVAAVVGAAIWIPYFMKSERVRLTFVEPEKMFAAQDPQDIVDVPEGKETTPADSDREF